MPARITSATYAPYDSTSATRPQKNRDVGTPWRPRAGIPKPSMNTSRMVGMPRKMSV